ncbi:MAG: pyridoxal phosphate-dependent aminotransferase [Arenimonas sp.]|nr:pyridoxal phosphate-dependent aminotransferase [Arenimonas sp.]
MKILKKSRKLDEVCYEIRGPALERARQLEEDGHRIIKLNIGNLAVFGFDPPDDIVRDVIGNLPRAGGYSDSKGIYSARKAVMNYAQERGIRGVGMEDIYIGNGVSELILLAMNALLDDGDEVLVPAPDYPLWTAAVSLSGGRPVHYLCDESADWQPDLDDLRAKITPATKALVVINPNNPTGAVYPEPMLKALLQIAREHQLTVFADEIYDKTLFDGESHTAMASLADDVFCISFGGLSKNYRACGYRAGWMILSGPRAHAKDYIDGLNIVTSMRLCANVPAQYAIQTALGGTQSIERLVAADGRLARQRDLAWQRLTAIPGVSCVKPKGALYLFPKFDPAVYPIADDQAFITELLEREKVLLVQGTGFNWPKPDHVRVVFLPNTDEMTEALDRIERFLADYRARQGT